MTRYERIRIGIVAAIGLGLLHSAARGDGWERLLPQLEWAESVQQTTDGGFIVAGSMGSDAGLIKTDASGNPVWFKSFGGPDHSWVGSVQQTSDGGFVAAGETYSQTSGDDVYLIKTDASGNELWTQTFGGSSDDYGASVQQTSDGGFIIVGETWESEQITYGEEDVYMIRVDESGNELWSNTFRGAGETNGYSVQQTVDGGFVVAGTTWDTNDASAGYLLYYKRGGAEPEIAANHSGFPVSVSPGTAIDVAISLAPVGQAGANADWWVVAQTPFGWYSFDLLEWQPGIQPIYQGPLFELPDFSILDSPLPAGPYTFYFGVDTNPNGVIDLDSLTFDSVTVDVSQ